MTPEECTTGRAVWFGSLDGKGHPEGATIDGGVLPPRFPGECSTVPIKLTHDGRRKTVCIDNLTPVVIYAPSAFTPGMLVTFSPPDFVPMKGYISEKRSADHPDKLTFVDSATGKGWVVSDERFLTPMLPNVEREGGITTADCQIGALVWYRPIDGGPKYPAVINSSPRQHGDQLVCRLGSLPPAYAAEQPFPRTHVNGASLRHLTPRTEGEADGTVFLSRLQDFEGLKEAYEELRAAATKTLGKLHAMGRWREAAHDYDSDVGNPLRTFVDGESWFQLEEHASYAEKELTEALLRDEPEPKR